MSVYQKCARTHAIDTKKRVRDRPVLRQKISKSARSCQVARGCCSSNSGAYNPPGIRNRSELLSSPSPSMTCFPNLDFRGRSVTLGRSASNVEPAGSDPLQSSRTWSAGQSLFNHGWAKDFDGDLRAISLWFPGRSSRWESETVRG